MARGRGGVKVYIDGDTSGLDGALRRADRGIAGFGRGLAMGGLRTGALAAGAALTGLGIAAADGVRSLARIEEINAQTAAGIRSTGGAANVTRAQVEALAGSIETLTGIEAENIQQGQNLLLTFTNVRNEVGEGNRVFDEATQMMVDMSVRMKTDMSSSAMLLGKALNDPVRGMTALRRAGVQFTAQQEEQVAALSESGDLLGAQKIVLRELETQFGGSSQAFGQTMTGKVQRFGHAVGTVQEALVMGLLPGMERITDYAVDELAPKLNASAERIAAIWERPGLTPEERFTEAWRVIEDTGIPDAAGRAILRGLELVGTQGPAMIIKGLQEAPWPAKAVIGAILLAKLGPGLALAGRGIGAALGSAVPGGIAGGRAGRAAGPIPVLVTNPGFVGGAPGGRVPGPVVATTPAGRRIPMVGNVPGGGLIAPPAVPAPVVAAPGMFRPGLAGAGSRLVPGAMTGLTVGTLSYAALSAAGVPGAGGISTIAGGAATGATMGAGAGLPGIVVGALAGGAFAGLTMGFRRFAGSGEVEELQERVQRTTDRLTAGMGEEGRGRVERATARLEAQRLNTSREERIAGITAAPGINISAGAREAQRLTAQTRAALSDRQLAGLARTQGVAVARSWAEGLATADGYPGLKTTIASAKRTMGELEPAAREAAAKAMLAQSQELERSGRIPRGTTARLLRVLRSEFETELGQLPRTVPRVMAEIGRELGDKRALTGLNRTLTEAAERFGDVPRLAARTAGNARENYERVMRGLATAAETGSARQQKAAREAMAQVRDAYNRHRAANRELAASYDEPRVKALAAAAVLVGSARDSANAWASAAVRIGDAASDLATEVELASARIARAPVGPRRTGGAAGGGFTGWTPGAYTGRDPYVLRVDGDEAILNPRQQAMVPGGRDTLARIFAATGAPAGFAGGGYVNPVPGGHWKYGPGAGTHSRSERGYVWQDDDAWDIMAPHGTPVVAGFDGVVTRTSGFNSDPRFWGHGLYLQGSAGTLFYKHLRTLSVGAGARVSAGAKLGELGDGVNGGSHLHLGASPLGLLENLRSGRAAGDDHDGEDGHGASDEEVRLTPRQQLVKTLRAAGVAGGRAGGMANRIQQAGSDFAGGVMSGTGDLIGAVDRAGTAARNVARATGGSPEAVADAREEAQRLAEQRILRADRAAVTSGLQQLAKRMRALEADERRITRAKAGKKAKDPAFARIRRAKAKIRQQRRTLLAAQASLDRQLAELGDAQAAAVAEDLPPQEGGDAGLAPPTEGQQLDAGLSAMGLDDGLQDQRAERAGEDAARAEGITNPDLISARGQQAVLERRRQELQQMAGQVQARMDAISARLGVLWGEWGKLYDLLARTPREKARLRDLIRRDIANVEAEIEQLEGERESRREQHASLVAQATGIGFDLQALTERTAELPRIAETTDGSSGSSEALSRAEAAAATARREAGLANSFIRTAFSPGDIGSGGSAAITAAGGVINLTQVVNTLVPTDPRTLDVLARAGTAANWQQAPVLNKSFRSGY